MIDRRGLPGNRLKGCIISIYPCGISCRWLNACHIQTAKSVPIFVEGRVAGLLPCFLLGAFCGKNPRLYRTIDSVICVGLPVVTVLSYGIQLGYDSMRKRWAGSW